MHGLFVRPFHNIVVHCSTVGTPASEGIEIQMLLRTSKRTSAWVLCCGTGPAKIVSTFSFHTRCRQNAHWTWHKGSVWYLWDGIIQKYLVFTSWYLEPYGASLNISVPRVVCYKFRGRVGGPLHLGSHSELGLCHLNQPNHLFPLPQNNTHFLLSPGPGIWK